MGAKKKKGKDVTNEDKVILKPPAPILIENWVNIEFKLLNWKFMNFSMKFRENTHIFTIKKILQERHGRMDDLKVCFNSFADINEVSDEMLTLKTCGIKGAPFNSYLINTVEGKMSDEYTAIPSIQLFYDFKPNNFSDPVILFFK